MKIVEDYLDRPQCDTIKGFFIIMVFISHFMQYVAKVDGCVLNLYIGQLMVAPFLFFSGYGVMQSIRLKREYVAKMPVHRMFNTLLNFDIAVLVFIVADVFLCRPLNFKQIALSLICLDSVGNSNWYIFVILLCYATAWLSAMLSKRFVPEVAGLLCLFAMIAMSFLFPSWWYDTLLCFAFGMLYSKYKDKIDMVLNKYYFVGMSCVALLLIPLMIRCPGIYGFGANLKAIAFLSLIVCVMKRFPIGNMVLAWLGQRLFPLYIYQRLPMIIFFTLDPGGFACWRMPIYLVLCFAVTILFAVLYPKWQIKL